MSEINENNVVDVPDALGIAQAIDRVAQMARESRETRIAFCHEEREGVYWIVGPDGKAERRVAEPGWHMEHLNSPTQLQAFVREDHTGGDPSAGTKMNGVVFIDPTAMVYCYNRDDRRDKATCLLKKSDAWMWLADADKPAGGPKLSQVDFIRLLRITLRGCLPDNTLLGKVRKLKFTADGAVTGDYRHGKESMGKSIETAISGQASFPEELTLTVQPFNECGYKVKIECALELFPFEAAFRLTPYPLQLKAGMDQVLENLAGLFDGDDYPPCYLGRA